MARSPNWVFTLNNWTTAHIEYLSTLVDTQVLEYIVFGKETAPKTGTKHLQGYAEFPSKVSLKSVRTVLSGCHLEPRKGTQLQAITYAKKEGDYTELGTPKRQGARTDLADIRRAVSDGGVRSVIEQGFSFPQIRYAEKYLTYCEPPRTGPVQVYWYHGPPESGKTRTAFEKYPKAYIKASDSKWWDGYDGHTEVILDDFRGTEYFTHKTMLHLLDRYPFRVECKGGSRQFRATTIVVTAPYPPEHYIPHDEDPRQLLRRITDVIEFIPLQDD